MTAEIALLNKLAVTLAADSAVTIGSGDATKVYNSADKIFEATNHDPIGIMVYNSPELNGVPVESIIKMFRDGICRKHYSTVFSFADAFLAHLVGLETPEITVDQNIRLLSFANLVSMRRLSEQVFNEFFRSVSAGEREISIDEFEQELSLLIDVELQTLAEMPTPDWARDLSEVDIISAHGSVLSDLRENIFEDMILSEAVHAKIDYVAAAFLLKEFERSALTGLVFAGFGKDEIFPSLISYEVYGIVAGRLKSACTTKFDVDRKLEPDAAILPFAQKEMADRFIYGLDSEFLDLCDRFFSGALTHLKLKLTDLLGQDSDAATAITPAIDAIRQEFADVVVPDHFVRSRTQLSDMVRSMPKQELAALCESLVHITSLKRKFSAGAESVGGPIDVAMITKAEGFVWVKRKHYFAPELNPRYFHRRYGAGYRPAIVASEQIQS